MVQVRLPRLLLSPSRDWAEKTSKLARRRQLLISKSSYSQRLARRIWPAALHYGQVCAAARGTRPAGMPNLEHTRACTVKLLTFGHVHSARAQERLSHARHPLCVTQNQRAHPCGACEPGRRAAAPTRCSRSSSSAARSETSSGVLWERASTNEAALDSDETCQNLTQKTIRYCRGS